MHNFPGIPVVSDGADETMDRDDVEAAVATILSPVRAVLEMDDGDLAKKYNLPPLAVELMKERCEIVLAQAEEKLADWLARQDDIAAGTCPREAIGKTRGSA